MSAPRAAASERERYRIGDLILDADAYSVVRRGVTLDLPPRTFQLLLALARADGRVVTRQELVERVWPGELVSDQTLSQRVLLLRRALGDEASEPVYVGGVRGVGYRLLVPSVLLDGDGPPGQAWTSDPSPRGRRSPYPGLAGFTETDAAFFFGRELEVAAAWERLRERRLVAVIGPPGAGKTSLVRAGVAASRPADWAALLTTPGRAPFERLAQGLALQLADDPEAAALVGSWSETDAACAALTRWRGARRGALVVVDQLEELFTVGSPDEQERFARLLGRLSDQGDVHVLLGLRDDFLMRCHELPGLSSVFDGLVPLGPLSREGLRRALLEPARVVGYRFEDASLVEEVVDAVNGERAALPLLAFAAAKLWDSRDPETRTLTRRAYERLGGVAGTLAQHAETTLQQIGPERQPIVRGLFRSLVTAQGTRVGLARSELLGALRGQAGAEEVLQFLLDARLLSTGDDPHGSDATDGDGQRIQIVHESLLTAWPRLVRWRAQDQDGAVLRDQLRQAAQLWHERGKPAGLLWTGTALAEFALWRRHSDVPLTPAELEFATAMGEQADRLARRRWTAVAAVIAVLLAGVLSTAALWRRSEGARAEAQAAAALAEASRLVALGRLHLDSDPTAALAYVLASLERADSYEARHLAVETLWKGPVARVLPAALPECECVSLSGSPDGRWLACAGFTPAVCLFPSDGGAPRVVRGNEPVASVRQVVFDAAGRRFATTARGDDCVRAWTTDGKEDGTFAGDVLWFGVRHDDGLLSLAPETAGPGGLVLRSGWPGSRSPLPIARWVPPRGVGAVDVDGSGTWLAYGHERSVRLATLEPGRAPRRDRPLGSHPRPVEDVAISTDGRRVFSRDDAGEVRVFDPTSGRLLRRLTGSPPRRYSPLALDRQGALMAWAPAGQQVVQVWDVDGPAGAEPLRLFRSDLQSDGGAAAFLGDGRWLSSTSLTSISFWPLRVPTVIVFRGHLSGAILGLAFTPGSRELVSCSAGDGARVWALSPGAGEPRALRPRGDSPCYGVDVDPTGRNLVLAVPTRGGYLVPVAGGPAREILPVGPTTSLLAAGFDASGRWVAVAPNYAPSAMDMQLQLLDLTTGAVRRFPLRAADRGGPYEGGAATLRFLPDGRLLVAGDGGIRSFDRVTGERRVVLDAPGRMTFMDVSKDGRKLVAVFGADGGETLGSPEVVMIDLSTGARRALRSHGSSVRSVALSPSGEVVATGDGEGAVRVGAATGEEPHLLLGHRGSVQALAFSPDGSRIASAAQAEVRLWPVPDFSRPPMHAESRDRLLERLRALTNVRVVEERKAPGGYRLEVGPFPGWDN